MESDQVCMQFYPELIWIGKYYKHFIKTRIKLVITHLGFHNP